MEAIFNTILSWIQKSKTRTTMLSYICKYLPYITALAYVGILIHTLIFNINNVLEIVLVPLLTFTIVTIIRKMWNRKRPYEKYNIPALFTKKYGESCPSRHTASAFSIALAGYMVTPLLGYILMVIAIGIAISRFLSGVHYPSDILLAIFLTLIIYYGVQYSI